jgi:hypothetical protein
MPQNLESLQLADDEPISSTYDAQIGWGNMLCE